MHCVDLLFHLQYKGPNEIDCDAAVTRGEELGWFQHGSTIIVFAPKNYRLLPSLNLGEHIRMGEALFEYSLEQ
jgi:phosphatidylserine decarboxylase